MLLGSQILTSLQDNYSGIKSKTMLANCNDFATLHAAWDTERFLSGVPHPHLLGVRAQAAFLFPS